MRNSEQGSVVGLVRPLINVTPLVDVLLVLLIIFMVIAPHRPARFEVRVPAPADDNPNPVPSSILVLTVLADLRLELNSTPVAADVIVSLLADEMEKRDPEARRLFIRAPVGLSYESVISLVDLAKGSGVNTIGMLAY